MLGNLQGILLATVLAAVLGFGGGYKTADWRLTAMANAEETTRADEAVKALNAQTVKTGELRAELAKVDDEQLKQLKDAQNETATLRDRLRAGAVRLRVAATCPASGGVPEAGTNTSVDNGSGAQLDGTSEQSYFALRDGIDVVTRQLAACQGQLRARSVP